jgi:GTP-binding protein EngB required for normal cell division
MTRSRLPLRLILVACVALGAALLLGLLVSTANSLLEFYARIEALPWSLRVPLLAAASLVACGAAWLLWRLARPARSGPGAGSVPAVTREAIEARLDVLRTRQADTAALEAELTELDRRRHAGDLHVALFGEISTGKSSLVRALAPDAVAPVAVTGGTTHEVAQHRGSLPDGRELVLADVPGSGEVGGALHEQLARDEALRAHAVIYLAAADLTRAQDAEITWLLRFGKPLLLVLNKADRYREDERAALLARWQGRHGSRVRAILAISAGGTDQFERVLADGRREQVARERKPDIDALVAALGAIAGGGAAALEPAREAAVLAEVGRRGDALARATAERESAACVTRYTRRAVVGALAAVAPGSDILIQGALATAMVRELARIHGVAVRELDVEALLARIGLTVRNTTALVLAIAGNALKAFPGVGTLGGGLLHAIAYGLVFDSVGHALAATLAQREALDVDDVEARVRTLLAAPPRERIERVARLALDASRDALRDGRAQPPA